MTRILQATHECVVFGIAFIKIISSNVSYAYRIDRLANVQAFKRLMQCLFQSYIKYVENLYQDVQVEDEQPTWNPRNDGSIRQ